MTTNDPAILARRLARSEERVRILESMLEDRAREVYLASQRLQATTESLTELFRAVPGAILVFGADGLLEAVNGETLRLVGHSEGELIGEPYERLFSGKKPSIDVLRELAAQGQVFRGEHQLRRAGGDRIPVLLSITLLDGASVSMVCVAIDLTERKKLEAELLHASKLESIGRLASGIAHEINTPIQFVGDSVHFAREAFAAIAHIVARAMALTRLQQQGAPAEELAAARAEVLRVEKEADLPFLLEELPGALDRALDGLHRVAEIVKATKAFAHPTGADLRPANLNKALQTTLTIAHGEYERVADIELHLGDLPLVACHIGELNQAFLNLLINAVHAIEDRPQRGRGRITITSELDHDHALVSIGDDGGGIPEAVQTRVFDPFFTTKDVGRGSGQGLAIARSVVVERHRGSLTFETAAGRGTTFFVRIPLRPPTRTSTSGLRAVR
ncbi:MAG: sensor histidine kinase [Polyangiaceae bacterium]|jgi:PAS domain S-box-containing protein|nr:sensor histidine kinase [Polyangiaceae bacterium]